MRRLSEAEAAPLRGGAVTVLEPTILPLGSFSFIQNVRPKRPGFIKRPGQAAQHTTADSTNKVLTLYQFRKPTVDENFLFAQMSDGHILQATNMPPAVTTGVFGAEVYSGSAGQIPASWSALDEILIMSNGADQHKTYAGATSYVDKFIVFRDSTAPPDVPQKGEDFSTEVRDGQTTTVAVLDSLDYYTNNEHCFFVATPVAAKSYTFTIPKPNGGTNTMQSYYRKSNNTWSLDDDIDDGTATGGSTLAVTGGKFSITVPTDEIPVYMYGRMAYWRQFRIVTAALDAEVEISSVTFDSTWASLVNIWNGIPQDGIEIMVEGTTTFATYGASAVNVSSLPTGKKVLMAFTDPIEGVYWDVGGTPNATGTALTSFKYWDGDSYETVGTVTDSTNGLSNSGWMRFARPSIVHPKQEQGTQYYAYWYEVIFDTNLSADMVIGIQSMPYFDVNDFGKVGVCSAVWRDRLAYSFNEFPEYVYITSQNSVTILNGFDFGILQAGDGRPNRVLNMGYFYNNIFVWQEEKGLEGGCTTIFQGYGPDTYGKLLLSSRIGIMNSKCAVGVEGILTSTATEEKVITAVFWLSRYGVCMSDGRTIAIISDDIQNYFDFTKPECIRFGYESENFLVHDATWNLLRLGLVSGGSATVPNVFPVFDLTDKVWYFDKLGQELSCVAGIEPGSGDVPIVYVGGGVDDGLIYNLNTGQNDVSTAIDSYFDMELNYRRQYIALTELILGIKAQDAGDITLTISANGIQQEVITLPMTPEVTNQVARRHWLSLNVVDHNIRIRVQHNTKDQDAYFEDLGLGLQLWERR